MSQVLRINPEVWLKHWCEFKHLAVAKELNMEIIAFTVREICGATETDDQARLIRMLHDLTTNLAENENSLRLLTEFTTFEATATPIEVTEDQYSHFMEQLGHLVAAEEHLSDHLKMRVSELKKATAPETKEKLANEVSNLIEVLDTSRLNRQNCVNRFVGWRKKEVRESEEVSALHV